MLPREKHTERRPPQGLKLELFWDAVPDHGVERAGSTTQVGSRCVLTAGHVRLTFHRG